MRLDARLTAPPTYLRINNWLKRQIQTQTQTQDARLDARVIPTLTLVSALKVVRTNLALGLSIATGDTQYYTPAQTQKITNTMIFLKFLEAPSENVSAKFFESTFNLSLILDEMI